MSVRLSSSDATPLEVLTESVKQLPVMRYALGVAGVGAVATMVVGWLKNPTAGFFSMAVVVVLMIVLIVVSWMLKLAATRTKVVAEAFLWFAMIVCVFVPLSFSVSSFFFCWPREWCSVGEARARDFTLQGTSADVGDSTGPARQMGGGVPRDTDIEKASRWPLVAMEAFEGKAQPPWNTMPHRSEFGNFSKDMVGGVYRWTVVNEKPRTFVQLSPYEPLDDFYVAVDIRIDTLRKCCVAGGLTFRGSTIEGYELRLSGAAQPQYTLTYQAETARALAGWTSVAGVDAARFNRLAIAAIGDSIQFFINGKLLGVYSDRTRLAGQVGLIAEAGPGITAIVEYDNFELRRYPR